jgi:hypothetical protein
MNSQATIIIRRSSEWMNRARSFKVLIDGNETGRIANGGTEEYRVEPGKHKVYCKIDWCSSREYEMELKEGESVRLFVRSGMKYYWHLALPVIFLFSLYLYYTIQDSKKPMWLLYAMIGLGLPAAGYFLYYTLISKKDYLLLTKEENTVH